MSTNNQTMHVKDACKILGISGDINDEEVKRAYQRACTKFHPDKGGSVEMMQLVNMARDALKNFNENINIKASVKQYGDKLNEAINAVITLNLTIEVCGAWIWLSGDTKPHKETLKAAGFRWASKKKKWYFRPEDYRSTSRGAWSMERIRSQYGSRDVDNVTPRKISHFNFIIEEDSHVN